MCKKLSLSIALVLIYSIYGNHLLICKEEKAEFDKGKKIVGISMRLLDHQISLYPTIMARITIAAQQAQVVLMNIQELEFEGRSKLDKKEEEFIKTQLELILIPVENFLDSIKEYKIVLIRIFEQCFGEKEAKESCLYQALDSNCTMTQFFSSKIRSLEGLKKTCTEFIKFKKDIEASLSDNTKKSYQELIKQLEAKNIKDHK